MLKYIFIYNILHYQQQSVLKDSELHRNDEIFAFLCPTARVRTCLSFSLVTFSHPLSLIFYAILELLCSLLPF